MSNPIDVVIFFTGLALWSNQVPNDPGNHVILPKVHYSRIATERMTAHAIRSDDAPHVVNHASAFFTYTSSFGTNNGWPAPVAIGNQTTFSYVPLDGDRVKFITGNPNPPLIINAVLPKLQGVTTLNPAGATIFDVPYGTMKSCLSLTRTQNPRLDTKLALTTAGNLIVSNDTGTKQIEIKPHDGTIVLVVADIPEKFLQGNYNEPSDPLEQVPHVNAFYAVTNASCGNCAQKLKEWFLLRMEDVEPCDSDITLIGGRTYGSCLRPDINSLVTAAAQNTNTIAGIVQGANFMCSNEGWP